MFASSSSHVLGAAWAPSTPPARSSSRASSSRSSRPRTFFDSCGSSSSSLCRSPRSYSLSHSSSSSDSETSSAQPPRYVPRSPRSFSLYDDSHPEEEPSSTFSSSSTSASPLTRSFSRMAGDGSTTTTPPPRYSPRFPSTPSCSDSDGDDALRRFEDLDFLTPPRSLALSIVPEKASVARTPAEREMIRRRQDRLEAALFGGSPSATLREKRAFSNARLSR